VPSIFVALKTKSLKETIRFVKRRRRFANTFRMSKKLETSCAEKWLPEEDFSVDDSNVSDESEQGDYSICSTTPFSDCSQSDRDLRRNARLYSSSRLPKFYSVERVPFRFYQKVTYDTLELPARGSSTGIPLYGNTRKTYDYLNEVYRMFFIGRRLIESVIDSDLDPKIGWRAFHSIRRTMSKKIEFESIDCVNWLKSYGRSLRQYEAGGFA